MLAGPCCRSGLTHRLEIRACWCSWWASILSFLHSGKSRNSGGPAPFQSSRKSPGSLSQIGIRGREPQAGTGKRAWAPFVFSQLKLSPSTCDSKRAMGVSCRNEWVHMRVYFCILKGLGLGYPLLSHDSVCGLGCWQFYCLGAILAHFVCILLLEVGLAFRLVAVCGFCPCQVQWR